MISSLLRSHDSALMEALGRSFAIVEFTLKGEILRANDRFLAALGYGRSEIVGRHHSMFVAKEYASSNAYLTLWLSWRAASRSAASSGGLPKAAPRFGSKRPIVR